MKLSTAPRNRLMVTLSVNPSSDRRQLKLQGTGECKGGVKNNHPHRVVVPEATARWHGSPWSVPYWHLTQQAAARHRRDARGKGNTRTNPAEIRAHGAAERSYCCRKFRRRRDGMETGRNGSTPRLPPPGGEIFWGRRV